TGLKDPNYKLRDVNKGIFSQLYENYERINSSGQTKSDGALLKVVCFKIQQSKQEILIDENLTMERMKRLFSPYDARSIPTLAFEELIEKTDRNILWNNYVLAIKSLIDELSVPR